MFSGLLGCRLRCHKKSCLVNLLMFFASVKMPKAEAKNKKNCFPQENAYVYDVWQKLKCACAMLNWSGLVVSHPLLNQAYAEYDYCIRIRELIPFSKHFVFRTTTYSIVLSRRWLTSIFRSPTIPNLNSWWFTASIVYTNNMGESDYFGW